MKKMNIKKKLYAGVLTAAMLASIGSASVFASGNISDTSYQFDFPFGSNTSYTAARTKLDNTSSYMKLTGMSTSAAAYNATVVNGLNNANFSKTWTYRFDSTSLNQGRYLSNYAKEDGYSSVKIKGTRVGSTNLEYWVSGVWSPDSI